MSSINNVLCAYPIYYCIKNMNNAKDVLYYARISSNKSDQIGSLQNQIDMLKQFGKKHMAITQ